MKKEFVPYELALKIKELGFDEPCFGWYQWGSLKKEYHPLKESSGNQSYMREEDCNAPLFQQVFRWFREKYQASPTIHCMSEQGNSWRYYIPNEGGEKDFLTYEEAELACLEKLIELVEQKEK